MADRIQSAGEYRFHLRWHRHVAALILGSGRYGLAPAVGLVVDHRYGMALGEEAMAQVRTYEPGATRNENSHLSRPSAYKRWEPAKAIALGTDQRWVCRTRWRMPMHSVADCIGSTLAHPSCHTDAPLPRSGFATSCQRDHGAINCAG
jgi:hypothetical protein